MGIIELTLLPCSTSLSIVDHLSLVTQCSLLIWAQLLLGGVIKGVEDAKQEGVVVN